jgi:membrane fusion protein (multidrug efflux system)
MNDMTLHKSDETSVLVSPRQTRKRLILLVVTPLLALVAGGAIYLSGGGTVKTDNAYVKADLVPISAEVSGPVVETLVTENQHVEAGQVLFRLDPASFAIGVTQAQARVAQVRTELAALQASYAEKQAELELARTRYEFAKREQERQEGLIKQRFVSDSNFAEAKQNTDIAQQQIRVIEQDLQRIAQALGGDATAPIEQHPEFRAAEAGLEQARLSLARTEVRAPQPGTITQPPRIGQYIHAGNISMSLVVTQSARVEANFMETDLTYVRPGQPVTIHIDTYPHRVWHGVVESLSPATGAEFSVIPAQNATGNWVKIAQRVPVRIKIDDGADSELLRAGLSAEVAIETGHKRRLLGLSI